MDKQPVGRADRRRRTSLGILASLLVIVGLVLAATAPAGPSVSNKLDAYGGPVAPKPTNPTSKAECDKYYGGPANQTSEVRGCRALAASNRAKKACAKKSGAKKAACLKAAKRAYAKAKAKVATQAKAEAACNAAYVKASDATQAQQSALDVNDPNYDTKVAAIDAANQAAADADTACLKKAQS
jgi:hypothetical protein